MCRRAGASEVEVCVTKGEISGVRSRWWEPLGQVGHERFLGECDERPRSAHRGELAKCDHFHIVQPVGRRPWRRHRRLFMRFCISLSITRNGSGCFPSSRG